MGLLMNSGEHHEIGDEGWLVMTRRRFPLSGAQIRLQICPPEEEQEVAAAPYRETR